MPISQIGVGEELKENKNLLNTDLLVNHISKESFYFTGSDISSVRFLNITYEIKSITDLIKKITQTNYIYVLLQKIDIFRLRRIVPLFS